MQNKEGYVEAYTRWVNSDTTKEVLLMAQAAALNASHAIGDDTIVGAAKAHWFRKGAESILNFLTTQMTVDQIQAAMKRDEEPDYGAEAKVKEDLFQ